VSNSRKRGWARYVARVVEVRIRYSFLKGKSERRREYLEYLCVDDKIIIKLILE
jgi:hypothetical protein